MIFIVEFNNNRYVRKSILFAIMLILLVMPQYMVLGELNEYIFEIKDWLESKLHLYLNLSFSMQNLKIIFNYI